LFDPCRLLDMASDFYFCENIEKHLKTAEKYIAKLYYKLVTKRVLQVEKQYFYHYTSRVPFEFTITVRDFYDHLRKTDHLQVHIYNQDSNASKSGVKCLRSCQIDSSMTTRQKNVAYSLMQQVYDTMNKVCDDKLKEIQHRVEKLQLYFHRLCYNDPLGCPDNFL